MTRFATFDLKLLNQARAASRSRNWGPQTFARFALFIVAAWLPVLGMAAPLVLEELLELEELLVVGVAVGVAELLELEELPVVGVAVAELLLPELLEELLVVGVAVGDVALLELEELLELEVPPVTGTPAPATLFMKLPVALTPRFSNFWRRPRSSCNQSLSCG